MNANKLSRYLIGWVSILSLPVFAIAYDTKNFWRDTGTMNVDFTDYSLSVQTQNVELNDLLKEISSKAGVKIIFDSPTESQISVDFKKKEFTQGLKLILSQLGHEEFKGKLRLTKTFPETLDLSMQEEASFDGETSRITKMLIFEDI